VGHRMGYVRSESVRRMLKRPELGGGGRSEEYLVVRKRARISEKRPEAADLGGGAEKSLERWGHASSAFEHAGAKRIPLGCASNGG